MARILRATPSINVEYLRGIHVVDSVLWFDAPRQADLCFVSHAHLGLSVAHKKVLTTPQTAALVREKLAPARALLSPYRRRFVLGEFELELFPAGHIPGSAQIRVTRAGERLVYTGHFNLNPVRTAEQAAVLECEVLVMPLVYVREHHVFPPRHEVEAAIVEFVKHSVANGAAPVLLASPLGNALELVKVLEEHGLMMRAHRAIVFACRHAQKLGVELPHVKRFDGSAQPGEVILLPPSVDVQPTLRHVPNARLALVSGRAVEPGYAERLGVDRAYPLSSHADRNAVIRYIRESNARRIFLMGADADLLAGELRSRRIAAWPLLPPKQLDFFRS
jgi:putative mRNA 3-end processing factor